MSDHKLTGSIFGSLSAVFFASAVAWFNDEFNSILVDIHFCFWCVLMALKACQVGLNQVWVVVGVHACGYRKGNSQNYHCRLAKYLVSDHGRSNVYKIVSLKHKSSWMNFLLSIWLPAKRQRIRSTSWMKLWRTIWKCRKQRLYRPQKASWNIARAWPWQ